MQSWIKTMLGSGKLEELPEELTKLLAQAKSDQEALGDLLKRSEAASKKIGGLVGTIEALQTTAESLNSQMSKLQTKVERFDSAASTIEATAAQAAVLAESQASHASSSAKTAGMISELTGKVNELQTVVQKTVSAQEKVAKLSGPKGDVVQLRAEVDQIMVDVSRLEVRSNDFAHVEGRITAVGAQTKEMQEDQKATQRAFTSVSKELKEMHGVVADLGDKLQSVASAKRELEDLAGPNGALAKVQDQVEKARERSLDYVQEVARLREDQAHASAAQEGVMSRYEELRSKLEAVDEGVDKANASVARIDSVIKDFTKAEELGARAERQLNALQALSDHINQKLASVERQREALDRTEAQARSLTDLHWELDAKLKEARSQIKEVKKVHSSVEKLREMNTRVAERSNEMRAEQASVERESKTLRAALAGVQEQMKVTTRRFELEKSTLEADGQRVIALRSDVTDLETRFRHLEEAGQSVNETGRKVDEMSARATSLTGDLNRLAEQVELVEGMRDGMSEARRTAVDVAGSLARLEARQSDVRDAVDGRRD